MSTHQVPGAGRAGIDPLALLDAFEEPAFVIDAGGVIRGANASFERLRSGGGLALPLALDGGRVEIPAPEEAVPEPSRRWLEELETVLRGARVPAATEPPDGLAPAGRWELLGTTPCRVDGGRGALVRLRSAGGRAANDMQSLEDTTRFLDSIVEHIPSVVFIKEAESLRYVRVNKHFEALFDLPRDQIVGRTDYDLFPKEGAEANVAKDRAVLAAGAIDAFEETLLIRGKGMRTFYTRKVPIFDDRGRPVHLLGIADDVTDRKAFEEARRNEIVLLETQRRLLEIIRELSTPVLPVHEGILVLPLVGQMDSARAAQLLDRLLAGIQHHAAETVIIDITGLSVVDTAVAGHLLQATRAAALLGSRCILVGVSPQIARSLVELGINLAGLSTHRDLQAGFLHALAQRGKRIVGS